MKALTLRNLPPHLARAIARRAAENKTSLSKAVISLLEEGLGVRRGPLIDSHDIDVFSGSWTREEAHEFDVTLRAQRTIDLNVSR